MPLSRRFSFLGNRRWWVVPALVAVVTGSHFAANAEEQVAARRKRAYCPPTYSAPPQHVMPYAPPTQPVPHQVAPHQPTPVQPTPAKPTDPATPSTRPTDPMPSTNNNTNNNNQTNTNPQTDPNNDLRNLPQQQQQQAPQTQAELVSAGGDRQSAAPNIIGDFFGATFAGNNSFLPSFVSSFDPSITGFPGAGSSVPFISDGAGNVYGNADGSLVNIPTDPNAPITGLVQLDPSTYAPIPGGQTFNFTPNSNGTGNVGLTANSQVFGPQTPGVSVGTVKLSESVSILPRDRILFNYSYFQQTPLASDGLGVNRMVPGFEKTFFNGAASIEVRTPFATTLNDQIRLDNSTERDALEMGDVSIFFKALLAQSDTWAFAAGLGIVTPTSSDLQFFTLDRNAGVFTDIARIEHRSVRLAPFVGGLWTPNDRLFTQGVFQIDTPVRGDTVMLRGSSDTLANSPLSRAGEINNPTFMYVSGSAGYWLYKEEYAEYFGITGFAPIMELHVNQSLTKEDAVVGFVDGIPFTVGGNKENITNMNATLGAVTQFGWNKSLYLGYATPLGNGADKSFDGELRAMFNWRFGSKSFRNVPVFQ